MNATAARKPATFSETDAAALMGCPVKSLRARFVALGYVKVCGRCLGSGRYSRCQMYGDTCFGCSGAGKVLLPMTRARVEEAIARIAAGELAEFFARNEARRAALAMVRPLVAEALAIYEPLTAHHEAEYQRVYGRGAVEGATFSGPISRLQTMANALRWGEIDPRVCPIARMGVSGLEHCAEKGRGDAVKIVALLRERIAMLQELSAAWACYTAG